MKLLCAVLLFFSFNVFAVPVNINGADAKTIAKSLHGIGLKKAEAIVKYRKEVGPFKTLKDVSKVKGIGEKTLAKNKVDILFADTKPTNKKK